MLDAYKRNESKIAATITSIAVALISASNNWLGSLHSRAEIPGWSGSAMVASFLMLPDEDATSRSIRQRATSVASS